ncbi:MAG: cytochrome c-type biogenesis protein CcmH [Candidatus Rokubacteria bacterium]|nr:cytochrome c-type biogenesis protein CcmH [Candidatus Rokubacteria bacterium]
MRRAVFGAAPIGLVALAVLLLVGPGLAAEVDEEEVRRIAAGLRCPVCQNLSVADSPSEMAKQMRQLIRERLAAGVRPEEVVAYFTEKYGEWILLAPKPEGFNLLVWTLPFAGLLGGLVGVLLVVRRWSRRPAPAAEAVDPAYRERIKAELDRLDGS